MNMAPTKKYTHVRRASAGFTLAKAMVFTLACVALALTLTSYFQDRPTDVVDVSLETRSKGEVQFLFETPNGSAVISTNSKYPDSSTTDSVWAGYWQLTEGEWKRFGTKIPITIAGNLKYGQTVELWFTYVRQKIRTGETLEAVQSAEVRPLKSS